VIGRIISQRGPRSWCSERRDEELQFPRRGTRQLPKLISLGMSARGLTENQKFSSSLACFKQSTSGQC
jgi:hypothetical protein